MNSKYSTAWKISESGASLEEYKEWLKQNVFQGQGVSRVWEEPYSYSRHFMIRRKDGTEFDYGPRRPLVLSSRARFVRKPKTMLMIELENGVTINFGTLWQVMSLTCSRRRIEETCHFSIRISKDEWRHVSCLLLRLARGWTGYGFPSR
jgi:hypothetical protein